MNDINESIHSLHHRWDLPAAMLLLAAMLSAAARLSATQWTENLSIVTTVVFFALIAGLALGKSRFSPVFVSILSTAYGSFVIAWQLGANLVMQDLEWTERLTILINRLGLIIFQLMSREPVRDSLLFIVLMTILFWTLGAYAGYTLVRYGNAWRAVLPGGLALFIIHSFDPLLASRSLYLAVYLFFSLVLVARMNFIQRHDAWLKSRTALPPHLGLDFIRFALTAAVIIVLFAWTAPALANALPIAQKAWNPIQQFWSETKSNFENAFASLRASVYPYPVRQYSYGNNAILGLGNPLSDAQMFIVNPPVSLPPIIRLYWRARAYDTYDSGRWSSTIHSVHEFNPQESKLSLPDESGRWAGSFEFISATYLSTLFTPAQPIWVNRPGQVEYIENPDGSVDISTFRTVPSMEPGQVYKAQASMSFATIAQLQMSGSDYPEWVAERYLQLPEKITPRTKQLAETITAGLETPYDKVVAVTNYLRQNITYVDSLPEAPPPEQEVIDWFLFDLKQGFCNYYSTAEIVLLRSIGIPARWAIGFAQGEQTGSPGVGNSYLVRQRDAHAWPEVYFAGIGWIEFEPTVSQPEITRLPGIDRDAGESNLPGDDLEGLQAQRQRDFEDEMARLREERLNVDIGLQQNRSNVVYWMVAIVLGAGMLLLGWRIAHRIDLQTTPIYLETTLLKAGIRPPKALQLWARRAALSPLSRSYQEVNRALSRLGKQPPMDTTPAERAERLGKVLPPAHEPARRLVNEYQIALFSTKVADLEIARQAGIEIRKMSLKAYLQRLFARLQQRPERFGR